jgi:hypothetical protein
VAAQGQAGSTPSRVLSAHAGERDDARPPASAAKASAELTTNARQSPLSPMRARIDQIQSRVRNTRNCDLR